MYNYYLSNSEVQQITANIAFLEYFLGHCSHSDGNLYNSVVKINWVNLRNCIFQ